MIKQAIRQLQKLSPCTVTVMKRQSTSVDFDTGEIARVGSSAAYKGVKMPDDTTFSASGYHDKVSLDTIVAVPVILNIQDMVEIDGTRYTVVKVTRYNDGSIVGLKA